MSSVKLYWAPYIKSTSDKDWTILYEDPVTVFDDLIKNRTPEKNSMFYCPSFRDHTSRTLVWKNPITTSFEIDDDGNLTRKSRSSIAMTKERPPSIKDNLLFSYQLSLIFFAEDDLNMTLTAPYFHKNYSYNYGAVTCGTMNVAKWFRPINFEYNLWSGVKEFTINEGDPIAYTSFDKDIEIHRFVFTEDMEKIAHMCATANSWEKKIPLAKRYERFVNSKLNKKLLKQIEQNLIY
jgi:hypothetical protein